MKILVVEDDEATRGFMVLAIKSQGHEVIAAPDGFQGLKTFATLRPDVVFSDILMPNMDGLEMLEKIRETDPDSLVIMNSTQDAPQYILRALALHANDYLLKPVLEKDLLSLLGKYSSILETRTRRREILGMIYRRDLGMQIANQIQLVGRIVDRLMQETEQAIKAQDRLGIHLGLVEILNNAIEHGNLEISYDEKTRALQEGPEGFLDLLARRGSREPFRDRVVDLEFRMNRDQCEWLITDQGPGFDWQGLPDPKAPENILAEHGRGIFLTRLQFDECSYLGRGNQVRLVKRLA